MDRRCFLKILGVVTGGSLLLPEHLIRPPEEFTKVYDPGSEFFFRINDIDFGPWIRDLEPPKISQPMVDVTTFDDPYQKFIPIGPPEATLGFSGNLPLDMQEALHSFLDSDKPLVFCLGHRPSKWSWSGHCFLKGFTVDQVPGELVRDSATFVMTGGPVEVHCA